MCLLYRFDKIIGEHENSSKTSKNLTDPKLWMVVYHTQYYSSTVFINLMCLIIPFNSTDTSQIKKGYLQSMRTIWSTTQISGICEYLKFSCQMLMKQQNLCEHMLSHTEQWPILTWHMYLRWPSSTIPNFNICEVFFVDTLLNLMKL